MTITSFYADAKRRIDNRRKERHAPIHWRPARISRTKGGVTYHDVHGVESFIPTDELRAARKAVRRGAKLLDQRLPGWESVLQLDKLELSSCELCVCGQLGWATKTKEFKAIWNEDPNRTPFSVMTEYLGIESYGYAPDPDDASTPSDFGFDSGYDDLGVHFSYHALEVEWHRLVSRRLRTGKVSGS